MPQALATVPGGLEDTQTVPGVATDTPEYYCLLTKAGAVLEAAAHAAGKPVRLSVIAVGDGNGEVPVPADGAVDLVHEVYRRPIDSLSQDADDPNVCWAHIVIPATEGGFWIREFGVWAEPLEEDGQPVLFAYGNHAPFYKSRSVLGQATTHELSVPVIMSGTAEVQIIVNESGYASRLELERLKERFERFPFIPFIATGSTTQRPLVDRCADVLNVRDFGAVGDGRADDTEAFLRAEQAADARGIKQVFVPVGTYRIGTFTSLRLDMLFGLALLVSDEGASRQLYMGGEGSGCEGCDLFAEEARNAAREAISAADEAAAYKEGILASYEDIMGKETFDALFLVNQFAPQMIASARQDILGYRDWYADGIEKIGQLDSGAMQMQQRCRNAINGHVRDLRLHRLQLAAADGRTPYLFIVAGQSNAFGTNKDGAWESAHDVAKFWWWDPRDSASGELRAAVDPVHRTVYENPLPDTSQLFTGSAWPAFCRTFFELSGHKVYILNVASGGAPVTPNTDNPDNSWDVSGTLRSMARTQYERLTAHLASAGLPYTLGGLLWCQGEAESERIPLGITTLQAYIDGTLDVFEFFRELTGKTDLPVFMSKIGFATYSDESDEYYHAGYTAVQNAQEQICKDNDDVHMAFRLAPDFVKLGYLSDGLHYNQTGYNMMGEALAHCAVAILNI